jgi:hypothetical protein
MNGWIAAGLLVFGAAALAWIDGGRDEPRLIEQQVTMPSTVSESGQ